MSREKEQIIKKKISSFELLVEIVNLKNELNISNLNNLVHNYNGTLFNNSEITFFKRTKLFLLIIIKYIAVKNKNISVVDVKYSDNIHEIYMF